MGFLLRWALAFALLALTYNPTPWNYVSWAMGDSGARPPLLVLTGLLLFVGYIIYLRATLRSIGPFGMILIGAIFAAAVWVLNDYELLALSDRDHTLWIGILGLSLVLGIGLSWSIVRREVTGQADVDDLDE